VAQVGVAGSTTLGHHCIIGGQAGIVGHITIGNCVAIGAQAGVINNVSDGKVILGAPAIDSGRGKRAYGMIQYLPEMKQSIRELQAQVRQLLSGGENEQSRPEDSQHSAQP
jgi:UDP-3-O-[3-hydroxymyristoyl] glucosamine N-acyltransferase